MLSIRYTQKDKFELRCITAGKMDKNSIVQEIFKENWNLDNFGPLKIPSNKIFVSEDSRIVWKIVLLIVMIVTFLIRYKIYFSN
ncbi:hypothetical protein SAMN04487762_0656 [Polaribacter sp. Hel1_33_78]|nr:hypothetical protein SAMN04487762_0656 [Polaribacter sp. Hel1_33_78]